MSPASAGASAAALRQSLLELLEPVIAGAGFDFEDVSVVRAGRRNVVRVVVDAEGGIDHDALAEINRVVSETLDPVVEGNGALARELAGSYTLEISSPGIDRPLTEPRHWQRNTGRLVATDAHGKAVTGRIVEVDDAGVTLNLKGRRQHVAWTDLGRGKVQVEFNRTNEQG